MNKNHMNISHITHRLISRIRLYPIQSGYIGAIIIAIIAVLVQSSYLPPFQYTTEQWELVGGREVKQNIKTVELRLPHNGIFKPFQTWGRFSAKKITTDKGEQGIAIFFPKDEFVSVYQKIHDEPDQYPLIFTNFSQCLKTRTLEKGYFICFEPVMK